jgi:acyl carrier protein
LQTYAEILSELYALLRAFPGGEQIPDDETALLSELGLTSLQIMDLLMEIEDRFDATVTLNRLPEIRTIGDLAAMLEKLVNGSPA